PKTVDVKFIFATNVDLKAEAQAGRFPFDLYQRLAQSQIRVPALSERPAALAGLAEPFLGERRAEIDLQNATYAPSLQKHLVERDYPGNIRELRTLVRELARRAAFELDSVLTLEHLPEAWGAPAGATSASTTATPAASAALASPASTPPPGSAPG